MTFTGSEMGEPGVADDVLIFNLDYVTQARDKEVARRAALEKAGVDLNSVDGARGRFEFFDELGRLDQERFVRCLAPYYFEKWPVPHERLALIQLNLSSYLLT